MKWLHFSDFHSGHEKASQKIALSTLVKTIEDELVNDSDIFDAIFLTGDIAFSGKDHEYVLFEKEFLEKVKKIPQLSNSKIFAVPGNHDINCDLSNPITWNTIKSRQSIFFTESNEGILVRKSRSETFESYKKFIDRNSIISPNPYLNVSILIQEEDFPIDIMLTNTAFFSDRDYPSEDKTTPCPIDSIRSIISTGNICKPIFLLGHHPINCFYAEHQKCLETLLNDENIIYLHGHSHEPKIIFRERGYIQSLGFGAAYQGDLNKISYYKNSFCICKILDSELQINGFSWDPIVGRWGNTTKTMFSNCSTLSKDNNFVSVNISTGTKKSQNSKSGALSDIPRKNAYPQSISILSSFENEWKRFTLLSRIISDNYTQDLDVDMQLLNVSDGKFEFLIENENRRDLLICIPGINHVMSAKEIESYNTKLDTDNFNSVIVLLFGKMSKDANDMYSRLKMKKSIEVLTNADMVSKHKLLLSEKQLMIMYDTEASKHTLLILITEDENLLLIYSQNEKVFKIIDCNGNTIPSTSNIITLLREYNPTFSNASYENEARNGELENLIQFDEEAYLKACYEECNKMKYAALANIGLRFSEISLTDVYVSASAYEIQQEDDNRVDELLDDQLAAYSLSEKLKGEIKQHLLNQSPERNEISQAREFCQKYNAVLITGDPGSGKTCFVKNEILAYAGKYINKDDKTKTQWHSFHIPVLIQLSQAAAESDIDELGLIEIISRLLERRGLYFPSEKINSYLAEGKIAFFFDGLDEIVSVEKRASIVGHINNLVSTFISRGNRIVVTSRPAAVNVVNLLPDFHQLALQGLTDMEIFLLASRILKLKVSETTEGLVLESDNKLSTEESIIINKLQKDCEANPGVARFATNPLLLTLLVMIYANSGAPSAKRHRIYEEAIKTLASVRGRDAGHSPVSVQDLRERLGAVALSVYKKESGFLPTKKEVSDIIKDVISKQKNTVSSNHEANIFIQKVAESTGLIAISGENTESSIITFMHHSFMEYFAAVSLSKELDETDVLSLVTKPRWIEILTLLAGIIGENEDITHILKRFIGEDGANFGEIDARYLIFALDCALECEVPSEATISLLGTSLVKCIKSGLAQVDSFVRDELGQKVAQLADSCGISGFEPHFLELLEDHNPNVCAATISFLSHVLKNNINSPSLIKKIEECAIRSDESVMKSICEISSNVEVFRSQIILQVIERCLKKTDRCRMMAFEAITNIPNLATRHWHDIINAMQDKNQMIIRSATKAAIKAGLDSNLATLNDTKKDVVAAALSSISALTILNDCPFSKIQKHTIESLLNSSIFRDKLIGIQLLPFVDADGGYIYKKLKEIIDENSDHRETVAAIKSFQISHAARSVFSHNDIKSLKELSVNGTSDVRKSTISLLGYFGTNNNVVSNLLEIDLKDKDFSELEVIYNSLGRAKVLEREVCDLFEKEYEKLFSDTIRMNEAYKKQLVSLLDASKNLGKTLRPDISNRIRDLILDYKQDIIVKKAALKTYPAIAVPSEVMIEYLVELLDRPPVNLQIELSQGLKTFARNCRQSMDYILACISKIKDFEKAAICFHKKVLERENSSETEYIVTELRDGLHDLLQIRMTFDEFLSPIK